MLGFGGTLYYDTFITKHDLIYLPIPLALRGPIHIWDIPLLKSGSAKAVRLRRDEGFRRRTLFAHWFGWAAFLLLIAGGALWVRVHPALGALTLAGSLAC